MEKGVHFLAKGVAKMYGCRAAEKKKIEETFQLLLSKEIILGHPCVPRVRVTRLAIRAEAWETGGRAGKGGGGRGKYEAQRVNVVFHVITCDLTATASHLLASAVPWIRITVSKSPFFNKSWKVYVLSYHSAQPAYKLIQRNRSPPPPTVSSLHAPPPPHLFISHPCVLYHVLLAWLHFPCSSYFPFIFIS